MNDPSTQTSNVLRTGKAPFESWLFDLDNTLYPAESNLFSQIDFRMGKFVEECLGVDNLRARRCVTSVNKSLRPMSSNFLRQRHIRLVRENIRRP